MKRLFFLNWSPSVWTHAFISIGPDCHSNQYQLKITVGSSSEKAHFFGLFRILLKKEAWQAGVDKVS